MSEPHRPATSLTGVSIRAIALPVQHGGWGFWLEPTLLGALVAPSLPGLLLSAAALLVFLFHHPFVIAFKDWRKGRHYARTRLATRFALIFGGGALLLASTATLIAQSQTGDIRFLLPIALSAPLAGIQLVEEARGQGRRLSAEIAGATLFAALAPASALQTNWADAAAFGLWAILIARAVPSIVYVRARLRLEKGRPAPVLPVIGLHAGALLVLAVLTLIDIVPFTALIGGAILFGRAALGTSTWRQPVSARIIGFREIAYGVIVILLAAAGYRLMGAI
ncbi:MAG: YwiC-like family protein [Anaerolinea sp.]|nr:YwiC-like family protein [Anaerolinea sp.]